MVSHGGFFRCEVGPLSRASESAADCKGNGAQTAHADATQAAAAAEAAVGSAAEDGVNVLRAEKGKEGKKVRSKGSKKADELMTMC